VWLEGAAGDTVTLQLLTGRDESHLQRQLPALGAAQDPRRLWVLRSRLGGQPVLLVLHGEFASIEAARAAIATLPPTLRAWSPQPRTVQGLRAELAAAGS
jgi:DamX protein